MADIPVNVKTNSNSHIKKTTAILALIIAVTVLIAFAISIITLAANIGADNATVKSDIQWIKESQKELKSDFGELRTLVQTHIVGGKP